MNVYLFGMVIVMILVMVIIFFVKWLDEHQEVCCDGYGSVLKWIDNDPSGIVLKKTNRLMGKGRWLSIRNFIQLKRLNNRVHDVHNASPCDELILLNEKIDK